MAAFVELAAFAELAAFVELAACRQQLIRRRASSVVSHTERSKKTKKNKSKNTMEYGSPCSMLLCDNNWWLLDDDDDDDYCWCLCALHINLIT